MQIASNNSCFCIFLTFYSGRQRRQMTAKSDHEITLQEKVYSVSDASCPRSFRSIYVLGTDSHSLALTENFYDERHWGIRLASQPSSSNMQCSIRISFPLFLHFYELRSRMKHFNRIFMTDEMQTYKLYLALYVSTFPHFTIFHLIQCVRVCVFGRSSVEQIVNSLSQFYCDWNRISLSSVERMVDGWRSWTMAHMHTFPLCSLYDFALTQINSVAEKKSHFDYYYYCHSHSHAVRHNTIYRWSS